MLRRYFIQGAPQRLLGVCPCAVTACYEQFNPHAVWVSGGGARVVGRGGAGVGLKVRLCRRDGGRMAVSALGRDEKMAGSARCSFRYSPS